MTGARREAGLSAYVIPKLEPEGNMPRQDDVRPGSTIPGEAKAVVRRQTRGRRAAETISPHAGRGEWLERRADVEIADVIDGNEIGAVGLNQ